MLLKTIGVFLESNIILKQCKFVWGKTMITPNVLLSELEETK